MKDITLIAVNWNQQPCVELLLKSFVKHHYDGRKIDLILVDNGSTDNSKTWLYDNQIPFIDLHNNIGHENALNLIYTTVRTKYALLCDSDVEFLDNVYDYVYHLNDTCISVGELIDKNYMNEIKIKDRISPWFWLFDIEKMYEKGMRYFRDPKVEDWTYDVGSWHWEKMKEFGFHNYGLTRHIGNQDSDLISMRYDKFNHIGKTSWNIYEKHQDRITEVERRRDYVKWKIMDFYADIDIKRKFI